MNWIYDRVSKKKIKVGRKDEAKKRRNEETKKEKGRKKEGKKKDGRKKKGRYMEWNNNLDEITSFKRWEEKVV